MVIAKKEKIWTLVGLGVVLAGGIWFGLAVTDDLLQGLAKMFGIFLGAGLAISGLIIAGIYFFRWQRINKLVSGQNVLAQWKDGEDLILIAQDCAYAGKDLHLWSGIGNRLDQVALLEKESLGSKTTYLEIEYANSGQTRDVITGRWTRIWKPKSVSIRLPPEQKASVTKVVELLQSRVAH